MRSALHSTLAAAAVVVFTAGLAVAQTPESGGSGTGTATLAGPAQKAGASNQNAGSGGAMMKHHGKKKKHMKHM